MQHGREVYLKIGPSRVLSLLKHPAYAGTCVSGRTDLDPNRRSGQRVGSAGERSQPGEVGGRHLHPVCHNATVQLRQFPHRYWLAVGPAAVVAALVIGVPTVLIPTPFFTRMTPATPMDYALWMLTSLLLGLVAATYLVRPGVPAEAVPDPANRVAGGGILAVLAIGCPICNKLVVLALGVSGALTYFAPVQPVLGVASLALLTYALWQRLRQWRMGAVCPVG